jgi:hypothetical protein
LRDYYEHYSKILNNFIKKESQELLNKKILVRHQEDMENIQMCDIEEDLDETDNYLNLECEARDHFKKDIPRLERDIQEIDKSYLESVEKINNYQSRLKKYDVDISDLAKAEINRRIHSLDKNYLENCDSLNKYKDMIDKPNQSESNSINPPYNNQPEHNENDEDIKLSFIPFIGIIVDIDYKLWLILIIFIIIENHKFIIKYLYKIKENIFYFFNKYSYKMKVNPILGILALLLGNKKEKFNNSEFLTGEDRKKIISKFGDKKKLFPISTNDSNVSTSDISDNSYVDIELEELRNIPDVEMSENNSLENNKFSLCSNISTESNKVSLEKDSSTNSSHYSLGEIVNQYSGPYENSSKYNISVDSSKNFTENHIHIINSPLEYEYLSLELLYILITLLSCLLLFLSFFIIISKNKYIVLLKTVIIKIIIRVSIIYFFKKILYPLIKDDIFTTWNFVRDYLLMNTKCDSNIISMTIAEYEEWLKTLIIEKPNEQDKPLEKYENLIDFQEESSENILPESSKIIPVKFISTEDEDKYYNKLNWNLRIKKIIRDKEEKEKDLNKNKSIFNRLKFWKSDSDIKNNDNE